MLTRRFQMLKGPPAGVAGAVCIDIRHCWDTQQLSATGSSAAPTGSVSAAHLASPDLVLSHHASACLWACLWTDIEEMCVMSAADLLAQQIVRISQSSRRALRIIWGQLHLPLHTHLDPANCRQSIGCNIGHVHVACVSHELGRPGLF